MNIAFVGCGYVADLYIQTLKLHPNLKLVGVYDRDTDRMHHFAEHHGVRAYSSYDELLGDPAVQLVLNLTNPSSHYEVSRAALEAGKHVYSEKPLAMEFDHARELVELAESCGLMIASAPCSLLSETAQTMWRALRQNSIGTPRLVYAEMDDGLLHRMAYRQWLSASGIPWPWKDELEVGCTIEHAGYCLAWLVAFFGPALRVTTFASIQVPDKQTDCPLDIASPDFSVACIQFESNVVARLTCSIVAPHDHTMRIIGDGGILSVDDTWFYRRPVRLRKWIRIRRRTLLNPWARKVPLAKSGLTLPNYGGASQMDYFRGVAEMDSAIRENRRSRLPADYCLHINELTLAIHRSLKHRGEYEMTTRFEPIQPMPWAS